MLSQINTMLTDFLGPMGPLFAVGFVGVVMILATLPIMLKKEVDPLDKLREASASQGAQKAVKLRTDTGKDKLEKYANFLEPQDDEEYSAIQLKLVQAGYRTKNAVRVYHFSQFALGGILLLGGLVYAIIQSSTGEPSTQNTIISILGPAIVGYMAPKYWVNKRQKERQEQIVNGFPDSLDMLLVCVEAGQSLDQSIVRVSQELMASHPALAEELEIVSHEMKAGKDKNQVLKDMSERCGVDDVASFVTVLIQSQKFGTSIADALQVYASEMRDKRVMRAEEKANTLPTKMTLATMMLTVPPLLIILIGPSVFGIYETLQNANFGG